MATAEQLTVLETGLQGLVLMQLIPKACLNHQELNKAAYKDRIMKGAHPITGFCYIASEAFHHMWMGKTTPQVARTEHGTHWYLRDEDGEVIDLTCNQFPRAEWEEIWSKGRGCGFLTKGPSKAAQVIIDAVNEELGRRL